MSESKRAGTWLTTALEEPLSPRASTSASPLLPRTKHARQFLRDVVEVIDESRPPKRLKLIDFQAISKAAIKPKLPEVKAFNTKLEMVHGLKPGRVEERPLPIKETVDTQRKDKPPQEQDKKISSVPAKAAEKPPPPQPTAVVPKATSFFVAGPVAADTFIEDSGFLGGEDESSEGGEASGEETTTPPPPAANPFFNSGGLFTKPGAFGKQPEGSGAGLFAGAASTNVFASFSAPPQSSSSLFSAPKPLFPFSTPPS